MLSSPIVVAGHTRRSYIKVDTGLMIMRIAIAGKMASGKTTLANALIERGFEKLSLGGKVKAIARDLFKMEVKDRPCFSRLE